MRVLHINSEYRDSKVHSELCRKLDEKGVNQTIYCFFKGKEYIGANEFRGERTTFMYSDILSIMDKILYYRRMRKVYKNLKTKVDIRTFDVTHSATLFSNGFISYKIFKEYRIPYVVAVRSTDFLYFRKAPHVRNIAVDILRNAYKVIFISEALRQRFLKEKIVQKLIPEIEDKFIVEPNGINSFWLENVRKESYSTIHSVIYVGSFISRKNVDKLILAMVNLRRKEQYHDLKLVIVGGGKEGDDRIKTLISENDFIDYKGPIKDKETLKDLYRENSIFAMPSSNETFGLVYIEALSQNLALLYTEGHGIYGMFGPEIGEAVNPESIKNIEEGLGKLLKNRENYTNKNVDFNVFNWDNIANKYIKIYEESIS